jgi:hypothetical protein
MYQNDRLQKEELDRIKQGYSDAMVQPKMETDTTKDHIKVDIPVVETSTYIGDTNYFRFNFEIDKYIVLNMLDSFVAKNKLADSATAALIIQIIESTDDNYCPFEVSKLLSKNDTAFTPTIAYSYLMKHYKIISFQFMKF